MDRRQYNRYTRHSKSRNTPKVRRQHALSWTLYITMGFHGSLRVASWFYIIPPYVMRRIERILTELENLEGELRHELKNIPEAEE